MGVFPKTLIFGQAVFLIFSFFVTGKPFDDTHTISYAVSNVLSGLMFGKRFEYRDPLLQAIVNRDNETIYLTGTASILVQRHILMIK